MAVVQTCIFVYERWLMFRVPKAVLDLETAQLYAVDEILDVRPHGNDVILECKTRGLG